MLCSLLVGTALAGPVDGMELGLGYRVGGDAMDSAKIVRATARKPATGSLTYELTVSARANDAEVAGLVHTLVAIAGQGSGEVDFQQPVTIEKWAADFLVDWSVVPRDPSRDKWTGGPRLLGGLVLVGGQLGYATYDNDTAGAVLSVEENVLQYGGLAGVSFDLMKCSYGLRIGFIERLLYRDKPQYDPDSKVEGKEFVHQGLGSIDFLVRF